MNIQKTITEKISPTRRLIVVSGYYGFDNLGDDAILEVLIDELSKIVNKEDIVVLSNNPQKTESVFGVRSQSRWSLGQIFSLLQDTKLFVSGGGGLFQDTSSIKSVVYYSALHHLAYLTGAKSMVFAQGFGPLNSSISRFFTKQAMKLTDHITVRDAASKSLISSLDVIGELTSDPVWCLEKESIGKDILKSFEQVKENRLLVGLSLRETANFKKKELSCLAEALIESLPQNTFLVPLVLQKSKDKEPLDFVLGKWKDSNRQILDIDTSGLKRPSQYLDVISRLDFVIGMRLHSLIMALSSSVPTFGLSYDQKVEAVMKEFDQPFLNLTNQNGAGLNSSSLGDLLKASIERRQESVVTIDSRRKHVKQAACKNFQLLARILS